MTSLCKAMYIRFFLSNSRPAGESLADRLSTDWGASGNVSRGTGKVVGDKKWGIKICIK